MTWYRSIKKAQDMNAPDAYTNYGHALTHARPDQPFPQEALADELWIWSQGRFQRMRDIPNILMKRLMNAYPGAQIKRFQ